MRQIEKLWNEERERERERTKTEEMIKDSHIDSM